MSIFSLPWYAAIGTNKALDADLPLIACVLIGVVGPTAGRYFIDITSGVTPQHFTRGEWFVGTAVLTSVVYIVLNSMGLEIWPATLGAFAVGFPSGSPPAGWAGRSRCPRDGGGRARARLVNGGTIDGTLTSVPEGRR